MRAERCALAALAIAAALPLLGWSTSGSAREDANRFILQKLRAQRGDNWDRVNREFLWTYTFRDHGCELSVERAAPYGDRYRIVVPLTDAVPVWRRDNYLTFFCQDSTDCIRESVGGPSLDADDRGIGQARLTPPNSNDLPKLADAFDELHRLCDDAYREPDRDRPR